MSQKKPQRETKAVQYQGKTLGEILKIKDGSKRQSMFEGYEKAYEDYLAQKTGLAPVEASEPAKITTPRPSKPVNVVALKPWSDEKRPASNPLLRSALFGAIRPGKRRLLDWGPIASLHGIELQAAGPRLDQNDLDAYLGLLHLQMRHPLGEEVRFRMSELLATLGKQKGYGKRGSATILHKRLERLMMAVIKIRWSRYSYAGHLVDYIAQAQEKDDDRYVLRLNPHLATLFAPHQYTLLDWEQRRQLSGQPLALWLHAFYSSHHEPYRLSVEKIRELSGSENAAMFSFRQELRDALKGLAQVTGWRCAIDANDKVIVINKIALLDESKD